MNLMYMESILLVLMLLLEAVPSQMQGGVLQEDDDGMSGTIEFGGPHNMNDEMMQSPFVPDQQELKCDACRAIAYQFWNGFSELNKKYQSLNYNLPESELIDLLEELCANIKTWEGYGMKKVKKVTRLAGPGLGDINDVPGVTASGGKWPGRLRDMCEGYVGDLGEVSLYKVYRSKPEDSTKLEHYLCHHSSDPVRSRCTTHKLKPSASANDEL